MDKRISKTLANRTTTMDDEECFDLLRELVNRARQGQNKQYVAVRKKIVKALKDDANARHFFRTVFKSMKSMAREDMFKGVKQ